MTIPTPEFIKNDDLTDDERKLIRCAANGKHCKLFDETKAIDRFGEFRQAEAKKPEAERRDPVTLQNLAIREQAAADAAPTIRADLIRFLVRGGNEDHPVDPYGVRLTGARITETLTLEGCRDLRTLRLIACHFDEAPILRDAAGQMINFSGSYLPGLQADRLTTTGSVFLRQGFEAAGAVRLLGAKIGGNLECSGGKFLGKDEDGDTLIADRLTTAGSVFLNDDFEAAGTVRLLGAKIGGDLYCVAGKFSGHGTAFHLQTAKVTGGFLWRDLPAPPKGLVNLEAAEVGILVDDPKSWPEKGRLILDGFRYGRIAAGLTDYASRRDWLERQRHVHLTSDFKPQPFEQLAQVLRKMGHTEDAKRIAMLKQRKQRWANLIRNPANPVRWFWFSMSLIFEAVVGFGYRPFRALLLALGFIAIGYFVFDAAYEVRAMVPNNPSLLKSEWKAALLTANPYDSFLSSVPDFQPFDPLVYSIDTFVPLVTLHQEKHWIPQPDGNESAWPLVRLYLWIHIAIGWIITALAAASLTGVVKKDV